MHQGDLVEATDGPVGTVESLVADSESGKLTHFVLRLGVLWDKFGQTHVDAAVATTETLGGELMRQTLTEDIVSQLSA